MPFYPPLNLPILLEYQPRPKFGRPLIPLLSTHRAPCSLHTMGITGGSRRGCALRGWHWQQQRGGSTGIRLFQFSWTGQGSREHTLKLTRGSSISLAIPSHWKEDDEADEWPSAGAKHTRNTAVAVPNGRGEIVGRWTLESIFCYSYYTAPWRMS